MSSGALGHLLGCSAVQRVRECPKGSNRSHRVLVTPGPLPKSAALPTLFSLVSLEFAGLRAFVLAALSPKLLLMQG